MNIKILLLFLLCLNSLAMESDPIVINNPKTLANIFNLHEGNNNILKTFLFQVLEHSTSSSSDKLITKLGLYFHPDKVPKEAKEAAEELFKLFQDLKHDSSRLHNVDPEKKPWLIKVPSEVKDIFVRRFFQLLETSTTYNSFKEKLDVIVTLAHMKDLGNRILLNVYAGELINSLIDNGTDIIRKPNFDELKGILVSQYSNFETIFNDSILQEESTKYAYLFDLLKEFQTFGRFITTIKPTDKAAYWFDSFNKYKQELQNQKGHEKNLLDRKRVSAAIILSSCEIDYREALFCDSEEFNLIERSIENWSNKAGIYHHKGYKNFKDYKKHYEDLYDHLKTTLAQAECDSLSTDALKHILNFIDIFFTIDNKTHFDKEKIGNVYLYCLNNEIPILKMLPTHDRDKELWDKNIHSFSDFFNQYQECQITCPALFENSQNDQQKYEIRTQIILRFIELKNRNSIDPTIFNKLLSDPIFSQNRLNVIDNYFFNSSNRSFADYVKSITAATNKYTRLLDNKTLSEFVITEDKILQILPRNDQKSFGIFINDIANDVTCELLSPSSEENKDRKILYLKALLDCYLIPLEIENQIRLVSCIPKQASFATLHKTVNTIRQKLIKENWFESTQNPELKNITVAWIKSTVKSSLLNIESQSFNEIKNSTLDDEIHNKKISTNLVYFNLYIDFVTRYYLIIPQNMIFKSFYDWLNSLKEKNAFLKTTSSLPFSEGSQEVPKNNVSLLKPIIKLLQRGNPFFGHNDNDINELDAIKIEEEAQKQLQNSWKFKVQQIVQFTISIGALQSFCQTLGSKLAHALINLKQMKNDRLYKQAYDHYKVNSISNPGKKAFLIAKLKTDYKQYSHEERLHKALSDAGPYLDGDRLKKNLRYF